jgi:hypothetical protein
MPSDSLSVRPSLLLFTCWVFFFALILATGYALSFLGLTPSPILVFILVCVELAFLVTWLMRQHIRIVGDPLELAGWLLVVVGIWLYFIYPSWPTLLPPSYSGDAAVHYSYINRTFLTGQIISDYPGGPAFIAAVMAHWMGWLPLSLLHPLGALWIALTASGIYGIACMMLPPRHVSRIVALLAPFALFITSYYFVGILIGPEYSWAQVASLLFLVAFVWFLIEHTRAPHDAWLIGMALCLLGISVSYPIWLALPVALFGWEKFVRQRNAAGKWRAAIMVGGTLAAFWCVSILTGGKFIPKLTRFGGEGAAVINPSIDALGGAYLLLPALGILFSLRRNNAAFLVAEFLALVMLQTFSLQATHQLFGVGSRWASKSIFIWIYPLALLAVLPVARIVDWALQRRRVTHTVATATFTLTALALGVIVWIHVPPLYTSPLNESEIQVARWARAHLDTYHVNYISRRGLVPQWLGVGFWGETPPDDLWFGQPQLGPKTYEEWRDDPSWGEYLFVASDQHFPLDRDLRVVYQNGDSMIVAKPGAASLPTPPTPIGNFGNALALVNYDLLNRTVRAGDVISFTAQIETQSVPAHQVVWRLQLRDLNHDAEAEARIDPFDNKFPLHRWPDGKVLAQPFALTLPTDLSAGVYDLELGLYYVGNGIPLAYRAADGSTNDVVSLGRIKVELPPPTTHELDTVTRLNLKVGDSITLLGYWLPSQSPIHPGESLQVDLYWQSIATPPRDFTAFVHLLDASGVLRAQSDSAPRNGTYPTSIWAPGEIIPDPRTITLPADAPLGTYRVEVGMYEWPSLQRLPIMDAANRAQGDRYILPATIRVVGR